jgi:hypothetical protein
MLEAQSLSPKVPPEGTIRMTKLTLSAILLALALMGCRSSMDTAAAAYLAMVTETDVGWEAVHEELLAAVRSDPARRGPAYGPAYTHIIAWREDFIRRLDALEFPDQVRDQVTALRAAEVAMLDVERSELASLTDPSVYRQGYPAYPGEFGARAEMRRVLGLPEIRLQILVQDPSDPTHWFGSFAP